MSHRRIEFIYKYVYIYIYISEVLGNESILEGQYCATQQWLQFYHKIC